MFFGISQEEVETLGVKGQATTWLKGAVKFALVDLVSGNVDLEDEFLCENVDEVT